MHTANVNLIKGVDVAVSAVHHGARHRKRDEKSDGRKEKPALRPITSMRVKQIAEARVVPKQQDDRDRQKNGRSKGANFSSARSRYLLSPDGILRAGRIEEVP